ncbi:MAG: hypothetical protein AAF968_15150 [Pseudomonadota bacterium]
MTALKIGAALMIDQLPAHRDWLYHADRDLEIQDFVHYETFRNGWRETADRVKTAPGDGEIEWRAVFAALAECRSNPHLVLELHDHAEIPKGFGYLQNQGLAV